MLLPLRSKTYFETFSKTVTLFVQIPLTVVSHEQHIWLLSLVSTPSDLNPFYRIVLMREDGDLRPISGLYIGPRTVGPFSRQLYSGEIRPVCARSNMTN